MSEVEVLSWGMGMLDTRGKAEAEHGRGIVDGLRMAVRESTGKWEGKVEIGSYSYSISLLARTRAECLTYDVWISVLFKKRLRRSVDK